MKTNPFNPLLFDTLEDFNNYIDVLSDKKIEKLNEFIPNILIGKGTMKRNQKHQIKKIQEFNQTLYLFGKFWRRIEIEYSLIHLYKNHQEAIGEWVRELRKENPDKKYYIMGKAPIPDALELDLKSGEITALEYETEDNGVLTKKKFYKKLGSYFDRVIIISENREEEFSPPEPNHINRI